MAVRNLTHLAEAKRQCGVSSTESKYEWLPRVQAKMLDDQRMENNEANRSILLFATFLPVQVYLALFYAELECVHEWQGQSKFLRNDELIRYFSENEESIDRLRRYRHSFLHPKPTAGRREREYLAYSESFEKTPEMQTMLDEYLWKVNSALSRTLRDLVARLPENDRLACTGLALKASSDWMAVHCDKEGVKYFESLTTKFQEKLVSMAEAGKPWVTPTPRQSEILVELAGYMSMVTRSRKEYQFEVLETRQPPLFPQHFMPLLRGLGSERYGDSRSARQAIRSGGAIRRLLMAAVVMFTEDVAWKIGHKRGILLESEELDALVEENVGTGMSQLAVAVAPLLLIAALLYEPLRCYSELKQEDPSVHDETLSAFTGDSLDNLREFRNSVFHVPGPNRDPNDLDTAIIEPYLTNIGSLCLGLAAFFGVPVPSPE